MTKKAKSIVFCAALIIIAQSGFSQTIDHWETILFANDMWQYKTGTTEPPPAWRSLEFDEDAWRQGRGGFGYGDGDDATQIPSTISFYLRKKFTIRDASAISSVLFHIDYDDAFVAWLNDREIARSAGLTSSHPRHNQTSSESHEAAMYSGGLPQAFKVSPSALQQGDNILAIQVHNQSSASSDMSALPFLSVGLSTADSQYRPTPSWFVAPLDFASSNIPILIINTQGKTIRNEPKIMARMGIVAHKSGRNNITDAFNEYDGWIGIELRGNASLNLFPKPPFTIETRTMDGANNNVKLLGMPKENDWILRAGYIDKTFCRDALAYYMSRSIGRWAPRTRHVELVLNGEYLGVYILMESIKRDDDRLDIAKMDSSDIAGENVTGGYIWEVAQAGPDFGKRRRFKYPKADDIMPQQVDYIRSYDDNFRWVMTRSWYNDPAQGYPALIDINGFVDEILIQEATGNSDAYGWSSYFHKDRNNKLSAGPVWDFDQALANSTFNCGDCVEEWTIEKSNDAYPAFWKKLWYDADFKEALANRWFEYRSGPLASDRLVAFVDSLAAWLNEAQSRNFQKWPILGVEIWRSTDGVQKRNTFQKEVNYMESYLLDHLDWMDAELYSFTSVHSAKDKSTPGSYKFSLSPNPLNSNATFNYRLDRNGFVRIKVYNVLGQHVQSLVDAMQDRGAHAFRWNGNDAAGRVLGRGIYFLELVVDHHVVARTKFVKF